MRYRLTVMLVGQCNSCWFRLHAYAKLQKEDTALQECGVESPHASGRLPSRLIHAGVPSVLRCCVHTIQQPPFRLSQDYAGTQPCFQCTCHSARGPQPGLASGSASTARHLCAERMRANTLLINTYKPHSRMSSISLETMQYELAIAAIVSLTGEPFALCGLGDIPWRPRRASNVHLSRSVRLDTEPCHCWSIKSVCLPS